MAPPNSRISRPACVLLADHERSWLFLDRVNSRLGVVVPALARMAHQCDVGGNPE